MKPLFRCLALALLSTPIVACVTTQEQEAAQEMVSATKSDEGTSLPPEATDGLASEKVTNTVVKERKEPELTPDDIEADNDPMKVGFETAKWNLSETAVERIRNVAEQLKVDSDLKLKIDGHCDERGTDQYNQILSEKRAYAVRDALVKLGISKKRLSVEGYGRRKAAMKGHSEKVYSHNRRVEMIYSKPVGE